MHSVSADSPNWVIWSKRMRSTLKRVWSECEITPVHQLHSSLEIDGLFDNFIIEPDSRFIFMRDNIKPFWETPEAPRGLTPTARSPNFSAEHVGGGYIYIKYKEGTLHKLIKDILVDITNDKIILQPELIHFYGLSYTCEKKLDIKLWCKPSAALNAISVELFTEKYRVLFSSNETCKSHLKFIPFEILVDRE